MNEVEISLSYSSLKENTTTEGFRRKCALLVQKTLWCFSAVLQKSESSVSSSRNRSNRSGPLCGDLITLPRGTFLYADRV